MQRYTLIFINVILSGLITSKSSGQSYGYDLAGRLSNASYSNGTQVKYAYDKTGNISAIATNSVVEATNLPVLAISIPTINGNGSTNSPYRFSFTWISQPGSNYEIQFTTDVASTNWSVLDGPINATNSVVTTSDFISTNQHRFYRIVMLP